MENDKLLKLLDDVLRFRLVSLLEVDTELNDVAAVCDRDEDELVDVALVLVDILDDGVGIALDAVGLALERCHGSLEGALLELTAVRVLKLLGRERHLHGEDLKELLLGSLEIVPLNDAHHTVPDDVRDIHADTLTHQGVATFLVDDGTLLVHHVIILEEVLTDTEVVFLHLLLGALDTLGDHRALDPLAILKAETVHDMGDTL